MTGRQSEIEGASAAAQRRFGLEDEDGQTRPGQDDRGGEPIGTGTDDDRIDVTRRTGTHGVIVVRPSRTPSAAEPPHLDLTASTFTKSGH